MPSSCLGWGHPVCQVAVVGHYESTGGVVIESSYREQPGVGVRDDIHDRRPIPVIANGSHHTDRFVHEKIYKLLGRSHKASVDLYLICFLHIIARFFQHCAVNLYITVAYQLISLSSACDPGLSYIFVYPHISSLFFCRQDILS